MNYLLTKFFYETTIKILKKKKKKISTDSCDHAYIYLSKDYPAGGYVVDYRGYEDYFLSSLKIMSERKVKKKKKNNTSYNIVPRIRNIYRTYQQGLRDNRITIFRAPID